MRNLQTSIPQQATVLARLEYPFFLDFHRNRIYVIDWPGGASLSPGMPSFRGRSAIATYLLGNSIQYVAYDYASEAHFARPALAYRLQPWMPYFTRTAAELTFDFQESLAQLGQSRARIYDDRQAFVLDLIRMAEQPLTTPQSISAGTSHAGPAISGPSQSPIMMF